MEEPFLSQFLELIRLGASSQDIHDASNAVGFATREGALEAHLQRELARVDAHRRSLVPLLERFVGVAPRILDVGCSTGGTTIALALSESLGVREVIGVDPNHEALDAARVRMRGYGLDAPRVRFEGITAGQRLPFEDASFDLVTLVSVLEFVSTREARRALAREIERVTRPGGHVFVATPSPWRFREFHSRRVLGHFRRRDGFPWSSSGLSIRRMFGGCDPIPVHAFTVGDVLARHGIAGARLATKLAPIVASTLPWQKILLRRRDA